MTSTRTSVRTSSGPRHGRRPTRAAGLRAPRFGALVLALAGSVALLGGAGAGVALAGTVPLLARPVPAAAAQAGPAEVDTVEAGAAEVGAAEAGASAVVRSGRSITPTRTPAPTVSAPAAVVDPDAVDAAGLTAADRAAGLTSLAEPSSASGDLVVVAGGEPAPNPAADVRTVRVEVEAGLDIDPVAFAATVMATLNDPRGWGADGSVSFARTDGPAQLRVVLASPRTVDELCAPLDTRGLYSCGRNGHAALNHTRWVSGSDGFTDMTLYRQYLVNHEVGHLLGQPHVRCPAAGQVAPIMQQQTVSVAPCLPNGWPFPDAG